jgi:hypothetical protein
MLQFAHVLFLTERDATRQYKLIDGVGLIEHATLLVLWVV